MQIVCCSIRKRPWRYIKYKTDSSEVLVNATRILFYDIIHSVFLRFFVCYILNFRWHLHMAKEWNIFSWSVFFSLTCTSWIKLSLKKGILTVASSSTEGEKKRVNNNLKINKSIQFFNWKISFFHHFYSFNVNILVAHILNSGYHFIKETTERKKISFAKNWKFNKLYVINWNF